MSGWLVVNRDVQWSDRTRQQLNSRGLSCDTAHNWQTAQQRRVSRHYDVIVVEEALDTGDGLGVIRHIEKDRHRDKSKFVLTATEPIASVQQHDEGVYRCESNMLADIDRLIQTVGC